MKTHQGSCLCNSIKYSFTSDINDYGYCHCSNCQKASGTAHSTNAGIDKSSFKLEDENQYLKEYESSPGTKRFFCSNCGSPIYTLKDKTPDLVRIRLGTLDTSFNKKAKVHTFVGEKALWHDITDNLPQFEKRNDV